MAALEVTSEERAFLTAILAEPGCDTARLVYADWLQEQGDDLRAEFIRVQVELERTPKPAERLAPIIGDDFDLPARGPCVKCEWVGRRRCHYHELLHRSNEILRRARDTPSGRWVCPALRNEFPRQIGFSRGFVAEVTCSGDDWVRWGDEVVAAHPIERVKLNTRPRMNSAADPDSWLFRIDGRRWWDWRDIRKRQDAPDPSGETVLLRLLAAEWPGITFTLPT